MVRPNPAGLSVGKLDLIPVARVRRKHDISAVVQKSDSVMLLTRPQTHRDPVSDDPTLLAHGGRLRHPARGIWNQELSSVLQHRIQPNVVDVGNDLLRNVILAGKTVEGISRSDSDCLRSV